VELKPEISILLFLWARLTCLEEAKIVDLPLEVKSKF
jgi:hypothetical protein